MKYTPSVCQLRVFLLNHCKNLVIYMKLGRHLIKNWGGGGGGGGGGDIGKKGTKGDFQVL